MTLSICTKTLETTVSYARHRPTAEELREQAKWDDERERRLHNPFNQLMRAFGVA